MSDYDNELRGALFRNDRKEKETHPDYKGQCEIDGTEYWISAWLKTSQAGKKFMSLSFEEKDAPRNPPAREPTKTKPAGTRFDDMDDDIPF